MAYLSAVSAKSFWDRCLSPRVIIATVMLVTIWVASNLYWNHKYQSILNYDAKGYYAYLPAVFIFDDLNFGFVEEVESKYPSAAYFDYRSEVNGQKVNKYYCGTALLELPFFLVPYTAAMLGDEPLDDGYSKPYAIAVSIAGLFYLFLGLTFLNLLLKDYGFSSRLRSFLLVIVVLGTNLFYYTVVAPGYSHIYSFAVIAAFAYSVRLFFRSADRKYFMQAALLLGLVVLIRPVNGLVVFAVPFIAGSASKFKAIFKLLLAKPLHIGFALLLFFAVLSVQLLIYKLSVGQWFVYSYSHEGFNFLQPHMFDILFSYRKGLFLYTPIYLVAFLGLIALWRKTPFTVISWFAFFLLLTYVLSSWWLWYYGGSFSSRVYVEFLPLFMILLGFAVQQAAQTKWKKLFTGSLCALILLCQIQTFQYRSGHIHWEDMTKEQYWDTFLRVDRLF